MDTNNETLSYRTIFRVVSTALLLVLIWLAQDAVVLIIVALVFTAATYPVVAQLHKRLHVSMLTATSVFFAVLLLPFVGAIFFIYPSISSQLPSLISQIDNTIQNLPYVAQMFPQFSITSYLQNNGDSLISTGGSLVYGITLAITAIMLTFYFVYDYTRLLTLSLSVFPQEDEEKIRGLITTLNDVVGKYIRGNLAISLITFVAIFVPLLLLHVPYAFFLALFAAVFDLLPLVGSAIGAIPSLLIAFGMSTTTGLIVLGVHILYQQVENAIISPYIYDKALNLYPALGFLAVLIGGVVFGILGAFLALPIAASIPAILSFRRNYKVRHTSHRYHRQE